MQEAKVTLIDENGKETEYKKFVLYGITESGNLVESFIKMDDRNLAYISKRLEISVENNISHQMKEMEEYKKLKNKFSE